MKLSPGRLCLHLSFGSSLSCPFSCCISLSLSLFFSLSSFRFLFIHIVSVTRAIQRNLVSSRRLLPSVAAPQLSTPRLPEIPQKRTPPYSLLSVEHHLPHRSRLRTQNGYNSAEHLSLLLFTFRPFSASRLPSLYIENNSFPLSNLLLVARIKFQQRPLGYTVPLQARRVIIFSGPSRYINKRALKGTRIISYFT